MRPLSLTLAASLLLAIASSGAGESSPDVKTIVSAMDRLYRAQDSYAEMEMTVTTPNYQRTLLMQAWSQGMDKTFIRILSPAKDRGVATLRNKQEMWNYFPKIDKVMKVPPSMMMGSWMGSDFTNDDLVKETTLLDDYTAALLPSPAGDPDHYYVELRPKAQTASVWGKIIAVVDQRSLLPVRDEYYDEKGRQMRVIAFKQVRTFGDRRIPAIMELTSASKPGNKTVIEYKQATFDQGVPESVFSLRNLQKKL
ncbi:MAG: outer membrane lipoprotein-sorting protein [candidate division FCPU426 bacterium]